jgi:hypothetical protein
MFIIFLINLLGLIATVIWFVTDCNWESGSTGLLTLGTFISQFFWNDSIVKKKHQTEKDTTPSLTLSYETTSNEPPIEEPVTKTPYNWLDSELYFSDVLARTFPGDRDVVWYKPHLAVQRLRLFFETMYDMLDGGDPVWWRRGGQAEAIKKIAVVDSNIIVLEYNRIKVRKMAVHVSPEYYKSYIYLEAEAESPTGLYHNPSTEYKESTFERGGYLTEEYAEFQNQLISRQEFDDGACVMGERVVPLNGKAKLRVRYTSPFNCIITAKNSPYNSSKFNRDSQILFHEALQSDDGVTELFKFLDTFTKADMPQNRSGKNIFQYDYYGNT